MSKISFQQFRETITNIPDYSFVQPFPLKKFGLFCGYFGASQAVTWLGISVCFMVVHITHDITFTSTTSWSIFYQQFLKRQPDNFSHIMFHVMSSHLLLSIVWLYASVWLLIKIKKVQKLTPNTLTAKYAHIFWAGVTFTVCFLDFVGAMVVVRTVIDTCAPDAKKKPTVDDTNLDEHQVTRGLVTAVMYLILFLLRGVVLWGINFMCGGIVLAMNFVSIKEWTNTQVVKTESADDTGVNSVTTDLVPPRKQIAAILRLLNHAFQRPNRNI